MMTGERKKVPGGRSGGEPRSFAPPKAASTGEIGSIREDIGEDSGDLSPADESEAHQGKNGRKLGDRMRTRRRLPTHSATGGIGGGSGAD